MYIITQYSPVALFNQEEIKCLLCGQEHRGAKRITWPMPPCPIKRGATGPVMPFYNSIIGIFIVNQKQFETNLLQLFAHPENSKCFSIISVTALRLRSTLFPNTNKHNCGILCYVFHTFTLPSIFFCLLPYCYLAVYLFVVNTDQRHTVIAYQTSCSKDHS